MYFISTLNAFLCYPSAHARWSFATKTKLPPSNIVYIPVLEHRAVLCCHHQMAEIHSPEHKVAHQGSTHQLWCQCMDHLWSALCTCKYGSSKHFCDLSRLKIDIHTRSSISRWTTTCFQHVFSCLQIDSQSLCSFTYTNTEHTSGSATRPKSISLMLESSSSNKFS